MTLLFTGTAEPARAQHREEWVRRFARENVSFELLPTERVSAVKSPHPNVRRAFELYRWLRDREDAFDVVHFPECQGHAYFAVLARAQGLAFARTTFVAGVHSCTRWCSKPTASSRARWMRWSMSTSSNSALSWRTSS